MSAPSVSDAAPHDVVSDVSDERASKLRTRVHRQIRDEVSRLSRYFDEVISVGSKAPASLSRFERAPTTHVADAKAAADAVRAAYANGREDVLVVMHTTANHSLDIEGDLRLVKDALSRSSRVLLAVWNPYFAPLYEVAHKLGVVRDVPPVFVTRVDLENIATTSGFAVTRERGVGHVFPDALDALGRAAIAVAPRGKDLCMANVVVLRPCVVEKDPPSLSVVIPARNEKGNIQAALDRLESWDRSALEILFVEGNSTDGTWEEIERARTEYKGKHSVRALKQTSKGKADAVRVGFRAATGDLVTILDADLTMPPELLHRFYDAYRNGHGDFINGSRLVYPMEDDSMRFLNRLGNVFFARSVSYVLETRLGDTLCGTKLLRRRDWQRIQRWRDDFGDFDPFGDFELLFPAAVLGLGVIDVPVRYRARTYGETNISRFRHGAQLLKMTAVGFLRVRL